ncbi:MAG: hypothetical protein ACUVWX_14545, partial [Kiritimatiellia bacterium]
DHNGNYLRTIYPFPRSRLDQLKGFLKWEVFPQSGRELPLKGGNYRSTLLTSGTNYEGGYLEQLFGLGALAMAVQGQRIALVGNRLNRLATDGTTGGLHLEGPETRLSGPQAYGLADPRGHFLPRSAAFSPNGKTLYITGWNREAGNPNWYLTWVPGVGKIDFEKGEKMEPFAGAFAFDSAFIGSGPGQFKAPVSVDTDSQGRVYVADRYNERIQIFDSTGKHLKDIPVPGGETSLPAEVCVNKLNGDVYVFCWYLDAQPFRKQGMHPRVAKLFHFGSLEKPELRGEYLLPIPDQSRRGQYGGDRWQGREFRATIDPWITDDSGPYIWLAAGPPDRFGVHRLLVLRSDTASKRLKIVKDFGAQTEEDLARAWNQNWHWGYGAFWLSTRPSTGALYICYEDQAIIITPDTGLASVVKLPKGVINGGLYFDWEGHAYLRDFRSVARFDADTWREIPFDYGEERGKLRGVVPIDSPSIHGQPAFSVSVHGNLVVGFIIGEVETLDRSKDAEREKAKAGWKKWVPVMFPGRGGNTIVRVWDKHGKGILEDAVRGVGYLASAFMGRDGNLYLATEAQREGYFDSLTGTMIKFKPNGKILFDEAPIRLETTPTRRPDTHKGGGHRGSSWWEDALWFYGGMGYAGKNNATCNCPKFQAAFDYFERSFVPETGHYSVAVLDSNGNLILRIGQYGNVDDGVPLVPDPRIPNPQAIGGDEVALFYPAYLATHTDRRLFINDPGNQRIVSVKLGYHAEEKISLKNVPEISRHRE